MSSLIRRLSQKIGIWLILFCSVSVLPGNLRAQTASDAIGTGTTWLLTVRYGMGVWALDAAPDLLDGEFTEDDYRKTYVRDTFEAAKTLQVLSIPVSEYQLTLDWLDFTRFNSAWQIAQKLQILSKAGSDITQVIATLLESRNPDSGFGGAKGYPVSNNLDTALALQAFKAANYSDTTLLGQSLNYLISNQNTDGGWGFTSGDVSNTYVTSLVLRVLSTNSTVFFINQNTITQASAFLLAHQNTDGGFGNSPSTIYDTALSLMSLIESGQGSAQAIQSGINYLTSSQLADGSWNDDPYSTALALQALAEARPNLTDPGGTLLLKLRGGFYVDQAILSFHASI
jgi:prenyltransferase beta subunit